MSRLLSRDVSSEPVSLAAYPADEVRAGDPLCGALALAEVAGTEIGIWEMTEGRAGDTEADEVFVVLSGRATVSFDDGEAIELGPGVAVRLRSGERTVWDVREPLRKIYVVSS